MSHIEDHISVALFGQNDLLREGLRRIIETNGFGVCIAEKCLEQFLAHNPPRLDASTGLGADIFLIDEGDLPVLDVESIASVHRLYPASRIVILHDEFDLDCMIDAFQAGVDGYLVKSITYESLVECLRLVATGEKVMPSALAGLLPEWGRKVHRAQQATPVTERLSTRELETLRCLSRGDPNKVIAKQLDISEATVKVHVKAILRKLGLRNRTQAAAWTLNAGLDLAEAPPHDQVVASLGRPGPALDNGAAIAA